MKGSVSPGNIVQQHTELVDIVDNSSVRAEFSVPVKHIGEIAVGQSVEIAVDAFKDRVFPGSVDAIDAEVDTKNNSILVRAVIPNGNGNLKHGMFASITLVTGEKTDVVLIDEDALDREGAIEFVWIVDEKGRAYRRRVLTGAKDASGVEILSGLKDGDVVVVSGQHKLTDGTKTKILNKDLDGSSTDNAEETGESAEDSGESDENDDDNEKSQNEQPTEEKAKKDESDGERDSKNDGDEKSTDTNNEGEKSTDKEEGTESHEATEEQPSKEKAKDDESDDERDSKNDGDESSTDTNSEDVKSTDKEESTESHEATEEQPAKEEANDDESDDERDVKKKEEDTSGSGVDDDQSNEEGAGKKKSKDNADVSEQESDTESQTGKKSLFDKIKNLFNSVIGHTANKKVESTE
jgi:hypothetical protein